MVVAELLPARDSAPNRGRVLGVVPLADIIKPGIKERFARLRAFGVRTVLITGDSRRFKMAARDAVFPAMTSGGPTGPWAEKAPAQRVSAEMSSGLPRTPRTRHERGCGDRSTGAGPGRPANPRSPTPGKTVSVSDIAATRASDLLSGPRRRHA